MTRRPRTIAPDALVAEALELISHKIQALLVVERGQVVGIVDFHDLMRIGAFWTRGGDDRVPGRLGIGSGRDTAFSVV